MNEAREHDVVSNEVGMLSADVAVLELMRINNMEVLKACINEVPNSKTALSFLQ